AVENRPVHQYVRTSCEASGLSAGCGSVVFGCFSGGSPAYGQTTVRKRSQTWPTVNPWLFWRPAGPSTIRRWNAFRAPHLVRLALGKLDLFALVLDVPGVQGRAVPGTIRESHR